MWLHKMHAQGDKMTDYEMLQELKHKNHEFLMGRDLSTRIGNWVLAFIGLGVLVVLFVFFTTAIHNQPQSDHSQQPTQAYGGGGGGAW